MSTDLGDHADPALSAEQRPTSSPSEVHFGDRFAAWMVDAVILFVAQLGLAFVLARQLQVVGLTKVRACRVGSEVLCEGPSSTAWALVGIVFVVVTFGYHAWFDGVRGATPGKRMVGLVVSDIDSYVPIGFGRGLVRSLFRQWPWLVLVVILDVSPILNPLEGTFDSRPRLGAFLFFVPLVVGGLMLLPPAVSQSGRALHDLVSRSRVVDNLPDDAIARFARPVEPASAPASVESPGSPAESLPIVDSFLDQDPTKPGGDFTEETDV